MADRARELTDKRLAAISKRLSREYNSARKELTDKLTNYLARADKRLEGLVAALSQAQAKGDAAAISAAREKLEKAKLNITLNDKRYREMINDLTDRLADVNQTALSYVNGQMPGIYRQNYNGAKEPAAEVGMSFSLMNEEAVARRVREGDIKLPKKKIDIPKDKRWNTKQLNSAVLQGIIQGESMQKIAKRILPVVDNNRDAAIRNARTMVTGAENEGRLDGYHKLEEEGAILKKVWIATADSRTREAHLYLDGQEVGIDEPFVDSDGNELMYPGDPSAEPGTVYNCRCSMRTHIVGFRKSDGRVEPVKFDHKSGMHQDAIEREKEKRGIETPKEAEKPKTIDVPKLKASLKEAEYEEYMRYVNADSPTQGLYEKLGSEFRYTRKSGGGQYTGALRDVEYSISKEPGMSPYSTLAHECSHGFDDVLKRKLESGEVEMRATFSEIQKLEDAGISKWALPKKVPSSSDEFLTALRADMADLSAQRAAGTLRLGGADLPNARNSTAGVQDALDGFFGWRNSGIVAWGHGDPYYNWYWNNRANASGYREEFRKVYSDLGFDTSNWSKVKQISRQYTAASEAWANVGSAVVCGGEELIATEKYMPRTLKAYKKLIASVKEKKK